MVIILHRIAVCQLKILIWAAGCKLHATAHEYLSLLAAAEGSGAVVKPVTIDLMLPEGSYLQHPMLRRLLCVGARGQRCGLPAQRSRWRG
jgi:hypothetical protein